MGMAAKKEKVAEKKDEAKTADVQVQVDNLEQLQDMDVEVSVELGRNKLTLDDALSLVELDKVVGEPVDIRINGKLFAKGEVVTVSENFGVRLIEIIEEQ
jgi:flagellar motor switch protein FliN/FliY